MGILLTLCVIVAVVGVILIVLGFVPNTAGYVHNGTPAGITLLVIGIVLYLIISLLAGHTAA